MQLKSEVFSALREVAESRTRQNAARIQRLFWDGNRTSCVRCGSSSCQSGLSKSMFFWFFFLPCFCWFVPAFCPTFCWRSLNAHHHGTQNWREPHHRILIINGPCCEIFIEISKFLKDSDSDQSLVTPNKYLRYL